MNEPANFAVEGAGTPQQQGWLTTGKQITKADLLRSLAEQQGNPPPRKTPPPDPNTPIFTKRAPSNATDYLHPPYAIKNAAGDLSAHTARTDLVHANGLSEYNVSGCLRINSAFAHNHFPDSQHLRYHDVERYSRRNAGTKARFEAHNHHAFDLCRCWCQGREMAG